MPLCWVSDLEPGLRRVRTAKGFRYVDAQGRPVRDAAIIKRINKLAIPPAYEQVWICAREDGHLQATGRDARGRKQYRYHPDWMLERGENKFGLLSDFALRLPRLRRQVQRRLRAGGLDRERVVAALVRLLDRTWMRIGHREYARQNGSYGLSTLLCKHVKVSGDALMLSFVGKSGVRHQLAVKDEQVAALVRRCRDLPGQELFGYEDDMGAPHRIDASDVNEWLGRVGGPTCSAKVFRTWHASVLALDLLRGHAAAGHAPGMALKDTLVQVSTRLGNTVAVCRKSYVHPGVLALAEGEAFETLPDQRWIRQPPTAPGLSLAERRLLGLLRSAPKEAPTLEQSLKRSLKRPRKEAAGSKGKTSAPPARKALAKAPSKAPLKTPLKASSKASVKPAPTSSTSAQGRSQKGRRSAVPAPRTPPSAARPRQPASTPADARPALART